MLLPCCEGVDPFVGVIKGTVNQEHAIPVIYEILRNHKDNLDIVLHAVTLLNQISTRSMPSSPFEKFSRSF